MKTNVMVAGINQQFDIISANATGSKAVVGDVERTIMVEVGSIGGTGSTSAVLNDTVIGGKRLLVYLGKVTLTGKKPVTFLQLSTLDQQKVIDLLRMWTIHRSPAQAALGGLTVKREGKTDLNFISPRGKLGFELYNTTFAA